MKKESSGGLSSAECLWMRGGQGMAQTRGCRWSSARAHLGGRDDGLVDAAAFIRKLERNSIAF
jgi:hypothetical protein